MELKRNGPKLPSRSLVIPLTILVLVVVTSVIMLLTSGIYSKKGQNTETQAYGDFKVELLFIHDGITVYRFRDGCRTVYFTSAGDVESITPTSRHGMSRYSYQQTISGLKIK